MPVALLYDSRFTALDPRGVGGVFPSGQVDGLIVALETVYRRAVA